MNTVGIFYNLVHIVCEGIIQLMQRVHLKVTATLTCYAVVVPPRELGNEDGLVVALHQIVVNGILQNILTAISQENLLLWHVVYL